MRLVCPLFVVFALALGGCAGDSPSEPAAGPGPASDRLTVATVNEPLAYFALRLGADRVEVVFPAPADVDPAFWSPDAETIAAYQATDLILLNGAGYAKWIGRAALPPSKLVDTSAGFADRLIPLGHTVTHSHGPDGEHEHGGLAFTTWLDPTLAAEQARAVAAALVERLPGSREAIAGRLAGLETDLAVLDERLAAAATGIGDARLLFSHPVYQYLIARYGLNGHELHWEPDEVPDAAMWAELDDLLEQHPARWMIWEDEPLETTAAGLEERGIAIVVVRPCGNIPPEGDWLAVMVRNAEALERIAEASDAGP